MELTKSYKEYKYWFTPRCDGDFDIWDKETNAVIRTVKQHHDPMDDDMDLEYGMWCERYEYLVGRPLTSEEIDDMTFEDAKEYYENLLRGVAAVRAFRNGADPDDAFERIEKTIKYLNTTDFFEAPASTMFHESEPHGLLHHTLKVVSKIQEVAAIPSFCENVNLEAAVLVALTHDWCKIGLYEMFMRNQKNKDGVWEQVPSYRRKDFALPMGHGAASMWQVSKFFRLSTEEALALRWHMGRWNVADNEINELQQSNENYPLVHLLQFADQLAITKY